VGSVVETDLLAALPLKAASSLRQLSQVPLPQADPDRAGALSTLSAYSRADPQLLATRTVYRQRGSRALLGSPGGEGRPRMCLRRASGLWHEPELSETHGANAGYDDHPWQGFVERPAQTATDGACVGAFGGGGCRTFLVELNRFGLAPGVNGICFCRASILLFCSQTRSTRRSHKKGSPWESATAVPSGPQERQRGQRMNREERETRAKGTEETRLLATAYFSTLAAWSRAYRIA
jgi:hypothetical protein